MPTYLIQPEYIATVVESFNMQHIAQRDSNEPATCFTKQAMYIEQVIRLAPVVFGEVFELH